MGAEHARLLGLWPLLRVKDMTRSLHFYQQQLGFDLVNKAAGDDGTVFWCRLARGNASFMLEQATDEDGPAEGRGRGIAFYIICDDVDLLHAELKTRGINLNPPQTAYYGMKQLFVPEPDGYELCFESETLSATPGGDDGGESE